MRCGFCPLGIQSEGGREADLSAGKVWNQEPWGPEEEAIGPAPRLSKDPTTEGSCGPGLERFYFSQLEKEWREHSKITKRMGKSPRAHEDVCVPEHWKLKVAGTIVARAPKYCPSMLRMQGHLNFFFFQNQIASSSSSYSPRSLRSLISPFFAALLPLGSSRTQGPGKMEEEKVPALSPGWSLILVQAHVFCVQMTSLLAVPAGHLHVMRCCRAYYQRFCWLLIWGKKNPDLWAQNI